MKRYSLLLIGFALLFQGFSVPTADAKEQKVKLHIEKMTCGSCPLTIRLRTLQLKGVKSSEVSFKNASATVTYDDSVQNPKAIADAISNLGYPTTILKPQK